MQRYQHLRLLLYTSFRTPKHTKMAENRIFPRPISQTRHQIGPAKWQTILPNAQISTRLGRVGVWSEGRGGKIQPSPAPLPRGRRPPPTHTTCRRIDQHTQVESLTVQHRGSVFMLWNNSKLRNVCNDTANRYFVSYLENIYFGIIIFFFKKIGALNNVIYFLST